MPNRHLSRRSATLAILLACALLLWLPGGGAVAGKVDPSASVAIGAAVPPATSRPVPGRVIRDFDPPPHPFGRGHRGVDLAAAPGDAVRAARAGRVAFAGEVAGTGWVTVDHGGGLATTYGGVLPTVRVGARVDAGRPVGRLAAGRRHLDWGARWRDGLARTYIDPMLLLAHLRARLVAPVGEQATRSSR